MWNILSLATVLSSLSLSSCQSQFSTQFQDFDVVEQQQQLRGLPAAPAAAGRTAGRGEVQERETTTPVPILKQINEHNEDGSYTYGYEAADGTFKLETRFKDGAVQGKYGYVDVNGEVKIIEYGANAMGFQPTGDLPEGIIIPPPVEGNCTDCDYDYDYVERTELGDVTEQGANSFVVQNRARESQPDQPAARPSPVRPSQNRGQDLDQPITQAPLPRRPEPAFRPAPQPPQFQPQAQQFQSQPQQFQSQPQQFQFQPQPQQFQPQPQQFQRQPQETDLQNPESQPQQFASFPAAPSNPLRQRSSAPSFRGAPEPSPSFLPTPAPRAPAPRAQAPPQPITQESSSEDDSGSSFANFPARNNPARARTRVGATAARTAPAPARREPQVFAAAAAPVQVSSNPSQPSFPAPQPANPLSPIRPAFENPEATQPRFSSFQPTRGSALPPRPVAQPSRPALTFQDPAPAVPAPELGALPRSALEIVDFNQLVQEFQGVGRPAPSSRQIQQLPVNTQTRFSTDNFPVRF